MPLNKKLTKKQQAIADREVELVQLAKAIVEEQGFTNLTMDRLTAFSAYSKGTIYNHFCSKEDVIIALCIDGIKQEAKMLSRGISFEGSTREKMIAMHVAYRTFVLQEPELTACVLLANSPWIIEKASAERVKVLKQLEEQVTGLVNRIVTEAVEKGELTLTSEYTVESIVFSNWSMAFGFNALATNIVKKQSTEEHNVSLSLLGNINMLFDGLKWLPLSTEHDYKKVWQKVEQELFYEEIHRLV